MPKSCLRTARSIAIARLLARPRALLRAFCADRGGNTTLIFALAAIPIFGAVGAAVDYSRGNAARTAMQATLDATTLMISKEALNIKSGQIQQKAKSYFNSQFTRGDVKNLKLTFSMTIPA